MFMKHVTGDRCQRVLKHQAASKRLNCWAVKKSLMFVEIIAIEKLWKLHVFPERAQHESGHSEKIQNYDQIIVQHKPALLKTSKIKTFTEYMMLMNSNISYVRINILCVWIYCLNEAKNLLNLINFIFFFSCHLIHDLFSQLFNTEVISVRIILKV